MVINYGDDCTDLRGSTEHFELLPRLLAVEGQGEEREREGRGTERDRGREGKGGERMVE